jgi:hypothetical protein
MPRQIAILGWGSLLWDHRPQFDEQHHDWLPDGPGLKLEFSRISRSRFGALTLVIDPLHGSLCQVAYALSRRTDPEDAICDLRSREDTTHKNIGHIFGYGCRYHARDSVSLQAISGWTRAHKIDVAVWTDLASNFSEICGKAFKVAAAVSYVFGLNAKGKAKTAEYMWRAPAFVDTPLKRALQEQPWFPKPISPLAPKEARVMGRDRQS